MSRVARLPETLPAPLERIDVVRREPEPILRVVVAEAGEMTLPASDVFSNRRFRQRCMERLLAVYGPTKPWAWERAVLRAMLRRPLYNGRI